MRRRILSRVAPGFVIVALAFPAEATEANALAISANIQATHVPFGTVLDPIFAAPASDQIIGYTRSGESAIWTGHYLAAEAFRSSKLRSPSTWRFQQCQAGDLGN